MAARTFALVAELTLGCPFSTRDTVWCDTPASRATSAITGRGISRSMDADTPPPTRQTARRQHPGVPALISLVSTEYKTDCRIRRDGALRGDENLQAEAALGGGEGGHRVLQAGSAGDQRVQGHRATGGEADRARVHVVHAPHHGYGQPLAPREGCGKG